MSHITTVQNWLAQNNYDIAYVSDWKNVEYFSGFSSDPIERVLALFIFPDKDPFIFAPLRKPVGSTRFTATWIMKIRSPLLKDISKTSARIRRNGQLKRAI